MISHLLGQGASDLEILTECVTYAAAGMVTTLGWEIYARAAGGHPNGLAAVYPALTLSLIALSGVSLMTGPPTAEERAAVS